MSEYLIVTLTLAGFLVARILLNKKYNEEPKVIYGDTKKIIIISCSNPFSWYSTLLKSKDEERKIFEVESKLTEDGFYRTIKDVAGPGVKGLINPKDTEIV